LVENSDHTWTLYGYGHVIKVYSAAEKETIDRVWHGEEFDLIPFRASGSEVTGISSAEAKAAEGLLNRLRTGKPYTTVGEREVGEGYMRAVEEKGIIYKRAEVLFGGLYEKTVSAGGPYAAAVSIGNSMERMFTLPARSASALIGEKQHGEYGGMPIKYSWGWSSQFKVDGHLVPCTSIPVAGGEGGVCAYAGQPVKLHEEWWEPVEKKWLSRESIDEQGLYETFGEHFVPLDCVADNPYPTCGSWTGSGEGSGEEIAVYVNVTGMEGMVGEIGFPAAGLGSHVPKGYEKLSGEYSAEPSYNFNGHDEATSLSNPDVAPLADELEIAYALQSSLLPGLEGAIVSSPIAPGEPPVELHQNRSECGKPVDCATGNETLSQTDLQVGGRGVGLDLTRSYNSQAAVAGVKGLFGYGWTSSFSDHLILEPAVHLVSLVTAGGATIPFSESGGSFTAPASSQDKLSGSSEAGYTLTLPDQTQMRFQGSSGRLESVTDRNGNETKLAYNATSGLLETITDPAGRKLTLKENAEGFVESAKDPMGHEVKYTYENETLATVTLPGEVSPRWSFKTDGSHQITEMTDGRGGKTTNKYNTNHQVEEQTDPMKHTLKFAYATLQTTITNEATGAVTLEHYAPNGEPTSITHGYGTGIATTESWEYNTAGYETAFTDGNEHTTKYGYDSSDDLTSMIDPDEHETKWEFNSTHDVMSVTTPKGETTTIKRDGHGNVEAIERPAPEGKTQVIKYTRAPHGEVESMTDPLGHVWKYEHDTYGDLTAEIDPENDKRTWGYNEDSQETSTVSPRGHVKAGEEATYTTKIERNSQGLPLTVTNPLGHTTKNTYDADQNLETVTDGNSHKTTFTYNADNERTKVKEPNGITTETEWNGAGQVISQTDGSKHETKYVRNILGEITERIDPLGRKTAMEYYKAGNLKTLTDPAKRTTTFTYDPANHPTEITYSDGKTHAIKFEYDADGERTKMTDGTGTTEYGYDRLDRPTESKDGHGDVVKFEYNLDNQQTKITYPNGQSVTRTYDKAKRLESVSDWLGHTTKFGSDADSDPITTTFPTTTSDVDKYGYNAADEMTEDKMTKGTETLASLAYARDNVGQVKSITSKSMPGEEKPGYTNDENNRLTKGGATAYEYDTSNDPTKIGSGKYTYDKASELETGPSLKYTNDELGERTKTTPTTGPATTYGDDQSGNLISVTRPEEGSTPKIEDTYAYNGEGLRASQTINGTTSYLTWNMSEELPLLLYDGTNDYIYGPGGLPIEQINNTTGTVLYLHHDQQGSTRLLTGSTGKTEATFTYGPYGATEGHTGTATTPLGYDAQYTSSDTGLIYLRAREYDPATAQFLSVDPLEAITRAPYTYGEDNPLNRRDPSGLLTVGICVGGEVALGVRVGVSACGQVSSSGEVGVSGTVSGGIATGAGASVGIGIQGSNAEHIEELGGPFEHLGGSIYTGGGVSADTFYGGGDACGNRITGGEASIGIGAGADQYGGLSETETFETGL
jgi:RHS repeat-associated protein